MERRKSRKINVGNLIFGNGKIYIQSMLNCPSNDIEGNIAQALELEKSGCDIIRAAVPDMASVEIIRLLKKSVKAPIVADIHFDYMLALESVRAGADKIRINPGNIGDNKKIKAVADICAERGIPIRIGVNSGSLEKDLLLSHKKPSAQALTESAMRHIQLLEQFNFYNIVVSIKSSNLETMVEAYRIIAKQCNYPLHLGVTETGTERIGKIKSAIGIGSLLLEGIGDTIRVSLTGDPINEVQAAKDILKALGLCGGINLISCPTCGRTKIDIISIAKKLEKTLDGIDKNITVAVMGCAVNGPGEAREADIGIAGGDGCALLFEKGKITGKYSEDEIINVVLDKISTMH